MKTKKMIGLVMMIVFMLACSLPVNIPGISGSSSKPQGGGSTPGPQGAAPAAGDKNAGPKTLDSKDPDLKKMYSPNLINIHTTSYESVDKSGAPYKVVYENRLQQQVEPAWGYYHLTTTSWNGKVDPAKASEGGQLNGKNFSIKDGKCSVSPDTRTHTPAGADVFLINLQDLQGTMNRVEDGVMMNGVLTDRYEIKVGNLTWFRNYLAEVEFKTGSLYRARAGGFLLRFEYALVQKYNATDLYHKEFDPGKRVRGPTGTTGPIMRPECSSSKCLSFAPESRRSPKRSPTSPLDYSVLSRDWWVNMPNIPPNWRCSAARSRTYAAEGVLVRRTGWFAGAVNGSSYAMPNFPDI